MSVCNPSYLTILAIMSLVAACTEPEEIIPSVSESAALSAVSDVIGEVSFDTSCVPEVREKFNVAIAMLHSFEFDESRRMFEDIAVEDPNCAMAHWGIAMTYYHPLWAPPTVEELSQGAASVATARDKAIRATKREQLYIEAIRIFFDDADDSLHRERARRYEEAMALVFEANPMDRETEIFYLLARLSNADPTDKTYAIQDRIGAVLEKLFIEMPNHPGLAHYIIHSYDYPDLAGRAVHAADRYIEIAETMPHALHMSGHIYTQLGMWDRSIHANILSVDAALERAAMFGLGEGTQNELHSLDYLVYAYLQRGENDKAQAIVDRVLSFKELNLNNGVIVFNSSAVPVRYAMERHDWETAAELPFLTEVEAVGGNDQSMSAVALVYWARVIGAVRSDKLEQAEVDFAELEKIAVAMALDERAWGRNTSEVFRLQAASWLALAKGEHNRAEQLMRAAADLEDQTDKSSISPGRVLPAHEQLGDLLAELDRPEEALAAYEESMTHAPGRFNTYLGAARAANAAGETAMARDYYEKLLEVVSDQGDRPQIAEARAAID